MEWILNEVLPADAGAEAALTLALTAEERRRSRLQLRTEAGDPVLFQLPRGTVLRHGDLLAVRRSPLRVRIVAGPEPVLTVRAASPHDLLKAAYHLGNRHVPLEVGPDYLRLSPDPVLAGMVRQLGASCTAETAPFEPETGAYAHAH